MSEKRFTHTDYGFIVDYESEQKLLNLYDVVDVLNELNDENQELKRLIKKMGELGGFNKHLIKTICEDLK